MTDALVILLIVAWGLVFLGFTAFCDLVRR